MAANDGAKFEFIKFGTVVEDLAETMRLMGQLVGYDWTDVFDFYNYVRYPDGREEDVHFNFVYSMQAPSIEYIQAVPGSEIWRPGEQHVGYSTPDFLGSVRQFEAMGLQPEVYGRGESDGPERFAYYRTGEGIRIEIVDRAIMPPNWEDFIHGRMTSAGGVFR